MHLQVDAVIEKYYKNVSNKDEQQMCLLSGERCPVVDPYANGRLQLHAAGVQCKDVSMMGSRQVDAGKCMPSQSLWLQERGTYKEDVVMNECTPLWDPLLLSAKLGPEYKVISFELDGHSHMGDVVVRVRRLSTGFNQEKCFLIADPRDFVATFGRQPVASAEILWWADSNDQSIEFPTQGSAALEVNEDAVFDWSDTLTWFQRDRLLDYQQYTRRLVAQAKVLETDTHIYDLDQNCPIGYKGATSAEDPRPLKTLISHGTIWNSRLRRPLLASEWLVAHGVPGVQGRFGPEGPVDMIGMMASGEISPLQMKSMVGNGWHLPSVGSWLMWILASTRRITKESPCSIPAPIDLDDDATEIEFFSPVRKIRRRSSNSLGKSPGPSPSSAETATPIALWHSEILAVVVD